MLNVVALMGRLVADPELRRTPQGVSVTTFTIAVDRSFAKQGTERQTDFIDIVAWRGTAEFICKYFQKGRMIAIDGSIQTRTYQDKNGNNRKAFEIVVNNANFVGSKSESGGFSNYAPSAPEFPQQAPVEPVPAYSVGEPDDFAVIDGDEDLPF